MSGEATVKQYMTGIVKQVQDGGNITIRGQPRNGPPPQETLALAELEPLKLARRPTANNDGNNDDPWAWEHREFLRKLLIGQSVLWTVSHTIPSGKKFGHILVGSTDPEKAENVAVKLLSEGLAKARDNCSDPAFTEAQEAAKAAGKGLHSDTPMSEHIRSITWEVENPRQLVDRMAGQPIDAIIESVRDGSTVRAFLLPDFYHVTLMMSGMRCPGQKIGYDGKPDPYDKEEFFDEALYFVESRLLQRDVKIILESVNNKNFVGSIIHPNGNIAEALLAEGYAKCVDWSLACVTGGPQKYRDAQAAAKQKRLRVWRDWVDTAPVISAKDKEFTGKVVEIVNGDAIMVKKNKTEVKKIFLASIRPPKLETERPSGPFRPLYDIPFMFEAREFMRKKLIGQNVHVIVDYIQPESMDVNGYSYPEKICGTVTIGGVNVAEALVSKGLATVVKYKAGDDQRSSHFDDLLSAEDKAKKSAKGMHSTKNIPTRRIADLAGDVNKSKQFLPFLQRAGRMQAVVEFIASGSRFRVYIPRETCVITFLLAGITCPRAGRKMPSGEEVPAEPWGDEAMAFVKDMILQREVEIEVEQIDKGGNFIGWCFVDNTNISVALVEDGYACSHVTAERSNYGRLIAVSEENARKRKEKRWANYVEEAKNDDEEKEDDKKDEQERKVKYETVVITEVTDEAHVYAQHVDEGPKLVGLMKQLREEFSQNPPLAGAFQPKRGDVCAAKFVDNEWYRVKVEKVSGSEATVLYMDYGNKATIPKSKCGSLPASFHGLPAFAKEYALAFMTLAPDEDYAASGIQALKEDFLDRKVKINCEYKVGTLDYVTVFNDSNDDLGKSLVQDGLMMVDKVRGRRLAKVVNSYVEAQESAKKNHLNIWEYGDITGDEAREFGAPPPRA